MTMRAQRGFSLVELLVVVAALAATTALAMAVIDGGGDQTRRDLTQARLRTLRLAMIGPAWEGGPVRAAGYAADVGTLPAVLADLLQAPDDAALDFGLKTPVFDPVPDPATGLNDGTDGVALGGQELPKGWRGPYLELVPGAGLFRDGWGNHGVSDDADNYGWGYTAFALTTSGSATSTTTPLKVTSLGKDGAVGTTDDAVYDPDVEISVAKNDWLVDVANWQVTVNGGSGAWYSVSLLVYVNGNWLRLSTAPVGDAAPASGTCGDVSGDRAMVYLDGSCDPQVLKFPANAGYASGTVSSLVPYGRHLLVVVKHAAGITTQTALSASATTVDLVRGALPPTATLEVRS